MDEEPGAVIKRLLEDGDVQIMILHRLRLSFRPVECATLCSKHCTTSGEFGNSRRFAAQPSRAQKSQEIRNPAPGFLISWVWGQPKTNEINNPAPLDFLFPVFLVRPKLNSSVFGRTPYQISTLHPLPWRIPKLSPICCRNPKPVKATRCQIFTFAACLKRLPKLSPICSRNPKPVHWLNFGALSAVLIPFPFNLKL